METKKIEIALQTLAQIQTIAEDLGATKVATSADIMPAIEDMKDVSSELVVWLAESAKEHNKTIAKVYEHCETVYSPDRSLTEILHNAYQFLVDNYDTIKNIYYVLKAAGYLHKASKTLLEVLSKKDNKDTENKKQ